MIALIGQIFCAIVALGLLVLIGFATWLAFSKGIEVKTAEFWMRECEEHEAEMKRTAKLNDFEKWREAKEQFLFAYNRLKMATKDIMPD